MIVFPLVTVQYTSDWVSPCNNVVHKSGVLHLASCQNSDYLMKGQKLVQQLFSPCLFEQIATSHSSLRIILSMLQLPDFYHLQKEEKKVSVKPVLGYQRETKCTAQSTQVCRWGKNRVSYLGRLSNNFSLCWRFLCPFSAEICEQENQHVISSSIELTINLLGIQQH